MIIIVGLGNPGKKFEQTRHNIGKEIIRKFAENFDFPCFKINKKLRAEITKNKINNQEIILALPTTYMNESGQTVKNLVTSYKLQVTSLWVIHDDLDLPLGKIRISQNRSAAGHKGVQSIIDYLGTQNFVRFRIGIQGQMNTDFDKDSHRYLTRANTKKFVLQKFTKNEQKIVKNIILLAIKAMETAIKEGIEAAMNKFN